MTLQRSDSGKPEFRCDACGDTINTDDAEVETFDELVAAIKKDGWEFNQIDGEWEHYCPDHDD